MKKKKKEQKFRNSEIWKKKPIETHFRRNEARIEFQWSVSEVKGKEFDCIELTEDNASVNLEGAKQNQDTSMFTLCSVLLNLTCVAITRAKKA